MRGKPGGKTTQGPLFRDLLRSFPWPPGLRELPRAEEAAPPNRFRDCSLSPHAPRELCLLRPRFPATQK